MMKFITALPMLAATILGQPVADSTTYVSPSGLTVRSTGYQGDGFYLATFNKNNVAEVKFTPLNELNATVLRDYHARAAASTDQLHTRGQLNGRDGPGCSGQNGYIPDMDTANVQLAHNGDGNYYAKHAWGWVHYNSVTSYFCNYQAQKLDYQTLIDFQVQTSNYCGGSQAYGYFRCTNNCGVNDLSVGRTFNGDHFCEEGFYG